MTSAARGTYATRLVIIALIALGVFASAAAQVTIAEGYPDGPDYVFLCDVGFNATTFDFSFGDGESLTLNESDVYHTYAHAGEYTVTCTAYDESMNETHTLNVTVEPHEPSAQLIMAEGYPDDLSVRLICTTEDFEATTFDFALGDGTMINESVSGTIDHTYLVAGTYDATCTAHDETTMIFAELTVTVEAETLEPEDTTLMMAEWYPQDLNVVLICEAGFEAHTYDYHFGDGQHVVGIDRDDVYHTYENPGTYEASCTAYGDEHTGTGHLVVVVTSGETPPPEPGDTTLTMAEWYPQDTHTVLICEAGFEAHTYDYHFGDGTTHLQTDRSDVYHIYPEAGTYDASCTAYGDEHTGTGHLTVTITNGETPPQPPETGDTTLAMAEWYPQDLNVVLVCNAGFAAHTYDYDFGDGQYIWDIERSDVYHTYPAAGTYDTSCTAYGDGKVGIGYLQVVVQTNGETPPPEPGDTTLTIAEWYPQDLNVVLVCNAGFAAHTYNYDFGDGQYTWDIDRNDVYHTYENPGMYDATCTAYGDEHVGMGTLQVVVS